MCTTTQQDPPVPPPPPFATPVRLEDDEIDVDLDENELHHDTLPEGVEYLGTFESIEAYLRSQLEPEVSNACQWILDCIDWSEVQARWESDGSRLMIEQGQVYRLAIPEPDPAGPWMPTRGA